MYQAKDVSSAGAGAAFSDSGTAVQGLGGATLVAAGGGAATMTIKEGTAGGRIIAVLGAPANGVDHYTPVEPIVCQGPFWVILTGSPTAALIEVM